MKMKLKLKLEHISPKLFECIKQGYKISDFKKDLIAGLTVGIVAVPLASAFAIASGLSPAAGFFTAIVAGFFISMFGGSLYQIGGPTGAFVVIVYGIVMDFGYSGLVLATLLAGLFLLFFAVMRLGSYIRYIPYPVIIGFTAGIAVILFSTEFKDLLGLDMGDVPASFIEKCSAYASAIGTVNPWALITSVATIVIILVVRTKLKKIPAHVFAVAVTTLVVAIFGLPIETIGSKYGELPSSLPTPSLSFSFAMLNRVIPAAFTIALLAAIESLLSAVVADNMTGDKHRSDTELFAQGVGNIASALFGGIPATGAVARTVTNIKAGAVTPVAGMIHAVVLLGVVMFFGSVVEAIPMAVIAGMLTVVSWDMFNYRSVKEFHKVPKSEILIMVTAFLLTVIIDITVAVEVGVLLAALMFMKRMSEVTTLDVITSEGKVKDPDDITSKKVPKGVGIYEINGPFFFGAADKLINSLESISNMPKVVILRMRKVPIIDTTGLHALETFLHTCQQNNATLILSGVKDQPQQVLSKSGLLKDFDEKNVTDHIDKALDRAKELLK
ncbi:MAG: STAS domain-containing protein [Deferribacteraceae bacterium]|jgi:SulP family sulfate permease|nr:STAS domain-containing protein [Deferribacteraceae bacterium]